MNGNMRYLKNFSIILIFCILILNWSLLPVWGDSVQKNGIKEVKLSKVLEIKETDDTFYFKYPSKVSADSMGNVYLLDDNRILKFSNEGKFVKSLVNSGQGPSEVTNISNFVITKDSIFIHNYYPSKIIILDKNGVFKNEFRLSSLEYMDLISFGNNMFYFYTSEIPEKNTGAGGDEMDVPSIISSVSIDGKIKTKVYEFPIKKFVVRGGKAAGSIDLASFLYAPYDERYLFISNLRDYNIKLLDLKNKKVIREISIPYEKQEIPEELSKRFNNARIGINGKLYRKPVQKYFGDIRNLLVYKNNLWVITSTIDAKKGVRVDVFDFYGKKIDSFFLLLEGHLDLYSLRWDITGDYIYSIETPEDGDPSIIKCKIDFTKK